MTDALEELHVVALLVAREHLEGFDARLVGEGVVVFCAGEEEGFCVFLII